MRILWVTLSSILNLTLIESRQQAQLEKADIQNIEEYPNF